MISYKPFFDMLRERRLNQYSLVHDLNISRSILDRLKNDKYLSLETIDKICIALRCDIKDVVAIF